jgi:hypothetical protein
MCDRAASKGYRIYNREHERHEENFEILIFRMSCLPFIKYAGKVYID